MANCKTEPWRTGTNQFLQWGNNLQVISKFGAFPSGDRSCSNGRLYSADTINSLTIKKTNTGSLPTPCLQFQYRKPCSFLPSPHWTSKYLVWFDMIWLSINPDYDGRSGGMCTFITSTWYDPNIALQHVPAFSVSLFHCWLNLLLLKKNPPSNSTNKHRSRSPGNQNTDAKRIKTHHLDNPIYRSIESCAIGISFH
jgi:hypothetical protein